MSDNCNYFVGQYVEDARDMCVASVLARVNGIFLGDAGGGKTEIMRDLGVRMSEGRFVYLTFESSTPPEYVKGLADPAAMFDSPPRYELITEGTMYDPTAEIVQLDEINRANDPVWDNCLHGMERKDGRQPVVWATGNFMMESERTTAFRDRFALWHRVKPSGVTNDDVVRASLAKRGSKGIPLTTPGKVPTWQEVETVRNLNGGDNATRAIIEIIDHLENEAVAQGFVINMRRKDQWTNILYATGAYYTGQEDFSVLPRESLRCLRWAYPQPTKEVTEKWIEIAGQFEDELESALRAAAKIAYDGIKSIQQKYGTGNQLNAEKRIAMSRELSLSLIKAQTNLQQIGHNDPRVDQLLEEINKAFAKSLRGEPLIDLE